MGAGVSLKVFTLRFVPTEKDDWERVEAHTAVGVLLTGRFFRSDLEFETFAVVKASVCCLVASCLCFSPELLGEAFSGTEILFGSLGLAFGCTWVNFLMDVCFLAVLLEAVLRDPSGVEFTAAEVGLAVGVMLLTLGVEALLVLPVLGPVGTSDLDRIFFNFDVMRLASAWVRLLGLGVSRGEADLP